MEKADDEQFGVDTATEEVNEVEPAEQHEATDEPKPSKYVGDLFIGISLIIVSILGGWEALNMPRRGGLGILTSPGITPILIAVALAVLSSIMIIKSLRGGAIAEIPVRLKEMTSSYQTHRVLILAAIITGYVLLIGVLDFRLVTFLFLVVTCTYVRAGRWYTILLTAIVGTVLASIALPYFFNMPTP